MTLDCGRCTPRTKRQYPESEFQVRRRDSYVLPSGHQLRVGAYHRRCGFTTMMQNLPVDVRGKIGATN